MRLSRLVACLKEKEIYYKGEEPVIGTADISSITDFAAGYIFAALSSRIQRSFLSNGRTVFKNSFISAKSCLVSLRS